MDRGTLIDQLQDSLHDSASVFSPGGGLDFERFLDRAADDLGRVRPRVVKAELSLEAGQNAYLAPADFAAVAEVFWGRRERRERQPWDSDWPGRLPRARELSVSGTRYLWLDPAPTAAQISALGASWEYTYFATHAIGDTEAETTVRDGDVGLLLLRAQAEAMKELALRNMHKPVSLRDGLSGAPRNGHPAALYEQLMKDFERQGVIAR